MVLVMVVLLTMIDVNVTGDNMTGALSIGPAGGPAVTTLADDGSASFATDVKINGAGATQILRKSERQ